MRLVCALLAGGLLAGCAVNPPAPPSLPARADIRDFELEARFALRTERPHEASRTASGRLSWRHTGNGDHILIATPLGQGIAEIDNSTGGARLRGSDGRVRQAGDVAELLLQSTGYAMPLGELPAWLLGRPTAGGTVTDDELGRPGHLVDGGWRIDYGYDDESRQALPARVTVSRDSELELRLRIEEWRALP